jgi:hypothetical protein
MCDAVFREMRTKERARTWTLDAMARFWIAVVLRAPDSLREALEEAHGGRAGFPFVESTTSSFFERAQGMRWEFFEELFRRFVAAVLPEARPIGSRRCAASAGSSSPAACSRCSTCAAACCGASCSARD